MNEPIEVSFTMQEVAPEFAEAVVGMDHGQGPCSYSITITASRPKLWRHPIAWWRWVVFYGRRLRHVSYILPRAQFNLEDSP